MATTLTVNGSVTLDESAGLQNSGTAAGSEDNNDNDVSLATLQANALAFYNRLFNTVANGGLNLATTFPTANGVAQSASNFVTVSSGGSVVDLGFVNGSGGAIPVYAAGVTGTATGLTTLAGDAISLFLDPSLGNDMVLGVVTHGTATTADDTIAFALYLQPTNGTNTAARVWISQFTPISNPSATNPDDPVTLFDSIGVSASVSTEFNFNALPSGQNLFGVVGGTDTALVVIGGHPLLKSDGTFTNASDTINTSQGGGAVTIGVNNQMFDAGESAFFTFVKTPNPSYLSGVANGLDQNEADDADNIQYTGGPVEANGGYLKVVQIQGGGLAALDIAASNISGAPQGTAFVSALGSGSAAAITAVRVYNSSGTLLEKTSGNADGGMSGTVTITISGGVAHVAGVDAGYKIEWDTSSNFDQVKVTDTAGKFDIGGFGINQPSVQSVDIGAQTRFEDDGPTVSVSLNAGAEVRVDESLGQNGAPETEGGAAGLGQVTVAGSVLFSKTDTFGTDGAAASNSTAWSLSIPAPGTDSHLDTTDGSSVLLYMDGADVVGRVGTTDVLRIHIDSSSGDVTLTQYVALKHSNANDPDESSAPLSMASGVVAAVRTIKDGDLDPASASADLGPALKFEDDGPTVTLSLQTGAEIRVDESLGQNGGGETEVGSLGSVTVTAAVLFNTTADFGQDGAAGSSPTVWSLSLSGDAVDSLLNDTMSGQDVLLYKDGNDVVGKTASGGDVVFRIAIDSTSGAVTLTQYRAMIHSNPNDSDESATPLSIASGLVSAVRTVTDGDGDHDAKSADIGPAMKFEDDGPTVTLSLAAGAEVRVDESLGQNGGSETEVGSLGSVTQSAAVMFNTTADFGQDGAAGTSPTVWSLSLSGAGADSLLNDTASGQDVLLYKDGNDVVGKTATGGDLVFRIAIDSSNGAVTLTQYRAMVHGNPDDSDESSTPLSIASGLVSAVRTITDGDGDHDAKSADIGPAMKFEDDGPTVTLSLQAGAEVRVDESLGQNGGSETEVGSLGSVTQTAAVLFNTTADFGQDGAAGSSPSLWSLSLSGAGADSLLNDTVSGQDVLLYKDGNDVVGKTASGGDLVFRIAIDSTSGAVTLTQYRPMVHGNPDDSDESSTPLSIASGLVSAVRTITDGDGDHDARSADIGPAMKFEDDGPTVTLSLHSGAEVRVDESLGQNGGGETEVGSLGSVAKSAALLFDTTADFGKDGAAGSNPTVWTLSLSSPGADSLLNDTASGQDVLLYKVGNDIVGKTATGGDLVFRIAIDSSNGAVTLTQYRSMIHGNASDSDESSTPLSIATGLISAVRTITDGDGDHDSKSADIGPAMKFEDDGPAIGPISNGLVNFAINSQVTNSLNGAVGEDPNATPYIITNYDASITINGTTLHGVLSANSQQVSYWADTNNDTIFGNAGDTEFYRLTLNESGAGSYLFKVLIDPPPSFQDFNFNALPSGQNLFGTVGSTTSALIVIGGHPVLKADGTFTNASDTINTSQGGGNVTIGVTNQMFDAGESAYFTLVKNPVASFLAGAVNGLDQNEADDADNMQYTGGTNPVHSAFVKIVQIQGNSLATMDLKATDIVGAPQGQALVAALGTGSSAPITAVRVFDANGVKVEDTGDLAHFNSASVVVTFGTGANGIAVGTARVAGLDANFKVEFDTSANFDQVKVTDVAGKFDVGGFGIFQGQDTPDQLLHFTAKATDGDGDHASASWLIGIDGTGANHDGNVLGL
jgi:glutamate synthase domain-containing protein 3